MSGLTSAATALRKYFLVTVRAASANSPANAAKAWAEADASDKRRAEAMEEAMEGVRAAAVEEAMEVAREEAWAAAQAETRSVHAKLREAAKGDAHEALAAAEALVEEARQEAHEAMIAAEAVAERPEVIIDFATLTGSARVALGTELPALFCNNDGLANDLLAAGKDVTDPLWRMPLWTGYETMIDGKVADINNAPEGGYGGSITAALFLQRFVDSDIPWAHIDLMAWNLSSKPGRPEGGAVMATTVLGIGSQHDFHRILSSFACIWALGALGLTFYL